MFNLAKIISRPLGPTMVEAVPPHLSSPQEERKSFTQVKYPKDLYTSELDIHTRNLAEYDMDIYEVMLDLIESNQPNLELYKQQPYLTFPIRQKLIDFLLKMSIRLKIIPFVFVKAVRLFDRYCSKRIVLLDQSQLIITTCLWISSKIQGGNNHFVNLSNLNKVNSIRTINDLGYGSGGKYLGPTERFRLPKLHELIKLCGTKCSYDAGMFKQMELHILNTLEWSLNDPSIEEFIVNSDEFSIIDNSTHFNEIFKVKEFLSYVALYSSELIDINVIELGQVILDLVNETLQISQQDPDYQTILNSSTPVQMDIEKYRFIKKNLIKAVLNSSDFILQLFNSKGPQFVFHQLTSQFRVRVQPPPQIVPTMVTSPLSITTTISNTSTGFTPVPSPVTPTTMSSTSPTLLKKMYPTTNTTTCQMMTPPQSTGGPMVAANNNNNYNNHNNNNYNTHNAGGGGSIPPPRQIPYSFNSSSSPTEAPPLLPCKHGYSPYAPKTGRFRERNHSQVSLSTTSSKEHDVFEYCRPHGDNNITPLSENHSPIMVKKYCKK
ncbi:HGC1 [[Candida] subhashii]|uniref:HGC1 n=1 Tax=[Candida] subhashii TaxID=561895 RepID=A0A8J5QHC5_9ASCO|nr:HGC1 [[Candida] subhashii]KAG7661395.1 HGC1 [[Candida] subhashii]